MAVTSVLDRPVADPLYVDPPSPTPPRGPGAGARATMAALAAGAGAIHLAMAPSHAGASIGEGVAFAAGGCAQLALAAALVVRPSKQVLRLAIVTSLGFAAAWAWSRTAGLPFGAHAGEAEDASFVDVAATGLELALVLVALAAPLLRGGRLLVPLAPLAVGALVAGAIVSPSARDHAGSSDHAGGADHHGDAMASSDGLDLITNGHAEHHKEPVALDAATQAELDAQIAVTREVSSRWPTVQHAIDDGYFRAGPYVPGIGAHFLKFGEPQFNADGVMAQADLENPMALIFTGNDPGDELAGYMYYSMSSEAPEGFAGPNDAWHYHEQLCMVRDANGIDFPFGPDKAASKAQCDSAGGQIIEQSQWMVHVWSVPGWDAVDGGVFAEVHPGLDCSDGTYFQIPPEEWIGRRNVCRSAVA